MSFLVGRPHNDVVGSALLLAHIFEMHVWLSIGATILTLCLVHVLARLLLQSHVSHG